MIDARGSRPSEQRMMQAGLDRLTVTMREGFASRAITSTLQQFLPIALTGLGVLPWIAYVFWSATLGMATDAHAYYVGQYGGSLGGSDAYLYSPAFSQLVEPLRWLGWDGFRSAWRTLEVGAMAALAGPFTGLLIFVRPVAIEVNIGNTHLLLALAVVAGFRWPAAWSFVLLTKVTPGVGLLWFAIRREWRMLGIALGVTATITAVSFAIAPDQWFAWLDVLRAPQPTQGEAILSLSLVPRLALAALLVAWGAPRNARWTVLVAALLALPSVWETGLAMLVGLWALRSQRSSGRTA